NMGGDLRVWGRAPTEDGAWGIAVEDNETTNHASDARALFVVGIDDGAIATSTIAKRRWKTADGRELHHLIDPRTGEPAATDFRSVTVIANEAMVAEIDAKVVLITGDASHTALPCYVVDAAGATTSTNGFDNYIW